jgi:hypothetical protein
MKVFTLAAGLIVAATSVVALNTATASAVTPSNVCDIPKLKLGEPTGKNMVVVDKTITATFTVTGQNCDTDVTLAVWKSPSANGQPINKQVFFGSKTLPDVKPGTHTITMTLPDDCYFQADLLVGDKPTAPDGTPNYAYQNGKILTEHPLRDFKFGGKRDCTVPQQPPKTPEPPKQDDPKGGPEEPQVKAVQTTTPTTMPDTGAGAVAATFGGVSIATGAVHAIVRRFKRQ